MKKLLLTVLLLFPILCKSQDLVKFKLQSNTTFQTLSGEDYVVVPFDGKSAHEIYQMLASNAMSVCTDPSEVMSVEDVSIKIRTYYTGLYKKTVLMYTNLWGAYYQLEFRIKDGRVRVAAPSMEEKLTCSTAKNAGLYYFSKLCKKWFKKNGEIKETQLKNVLEVENKINSAINSILGLNVTSTTQDDW
jgi:hypothetical protein